MVFLSFTSGLENRNFFKLKYPIISCQGIFCLVALTEISNLTPTDCDNLFCVLKVNYVQLFIKLVFGSRRGSGRAITRTQTLGCRLSADSLILLTEGYSFSFSLLDICGEWTRFLISKLGMSLCSPV